MSNEPRPWIVIDAEKQVIRCDRCETTKSLTFPIAVTQFLVDCKLFSKGHKFCKSNLPRTFDTEAP